MRSSSVLVLLAAAAAQADSAGRPRRGGPLFAAVFAGDAARLRDLLRGPSVVDVNAKHHVPGSSLLIEACEPESFAPLPAESAKTYLRFGGRFPAPPTGSAAQSVSMAVLSELAALPRRPDARRRSVRLTDIANHATAHLAVPRLLLAAGANANAADARGDTALLEAVRSTSLHLVKLLVEHGANVHYENPDTGASPLKLAVSMALWDVARFLLDAQPGKVSRGDTCAWGVPNQHKTPADVSARLGCTRGLSYLLSPPPPPPRTAPQTLDDAAWVLGTRCDFDVVQGLRFEGFLREYLHTRPRPAVVRGGWPESRGAAVPAPAAKPWRVPKPWRALLRGRSNLGPHKVVVSTLPYGNITGPNLYYGEKRLADFLSQHMGAQRNPHLTEHEKTAYVFDWKVLESSGAAGRNLLRGLRKLRPWGAYWQEEGFENTLGFPQLAIGPQGSGAPRHFHETGFSIQVQGKKLWAMWPPGEAAYSNIPARDAWQDLFRDTSPSLCVVEGGEVVYVPASWSHMTVVLSDSSFSLADSISTSQFAGNVRKLAARRSGGFFDEL